MRQASATAAEKKNAGGTPHGASRRHSEWGTMLRLLPGIFEIAHS